MEGRIGLKSGRKSLKDEIIFEYLLNCYMRRDPGGTGQIVGTMEAHLTFLALPVCKMFTRWSDGQSLANILYLFVSLSPSVSLLSLTCLILSLNH